MLVGSNNSTIRKSFGDKYLLKTRQNFHKHFRTQICYKASHCDWKKKKKQSKTTI